MKWRCVCSTYGDVCVIYIIGSVWLRLEEVCFIMKELECREQEKNERNEEENKRSAARTHRGPSCVCYGSVCEMKMKRGVGSMRTVIHTYTGRLGQAHGGYILHTSTEESTTVIQVCLVALKWQMNANMSAKHNIWIGLVDLLDFAPVNGVTSAVPHFRTIIHRCGMVFLVSFPAEIQSTNRLTSRNFELFIVSE